MTNDAGSQALAGYTYGATNQRLVSDEGGTRTYYAWSDGAVLTEYSETSAAPTTPYWQKNYIYLGNRLLATQVPTSSGERAEFHHPDRLGTRLSTNSSDTSVTEQAHLPFGTALPAESTQQLGSAANRRFTSYDRSGSTGLDYAMNRHYDSVQGRFTTVDPIGMGAASLANPQSLNMYGYVGNDPINNVDPDGLFFRSLFRAIGKALKIIAIAVAVAAVVLIAASGVGVPGAAGILKGLGTVLAKVGLSKLGGGLLKYAGASAAAVESGSAVSAVISGIVGLQAVAAVAQVAGYVQGRRRDDPDCSLGGSGPCDVGEGGRVVINSGRPPSRTRTVAGVIAAGGVVVLGGPVSPVVTAVVVGAIGLIILADILRNLPTGPPPLASPTVNTNPNILNEENLTDRVGKIASDLGVTEREAREAIHKVKRRLPRGGPIRNPDVLVDTATGEVYPKLPGGGRGDSIGNIFDHLKYRLGYRR